MNLSILIQDLELAALSEAESADRVRICDLTEDSRTAMPGSLFIARSGTKDDGSKHLDEAIHAGAVAVVTDRRDACLPDGTHANLYHAPNAAQIGAIIAERFYGQPSQQLRVAGVTGTNGKTTIAHLTQQVLRHAKLKCGLIGTVEIDDGRERSSASMTTPPAIELSRTLATMVEHGCGACSMEVSSHALDQGRTSAVSIDAAGFTNLTGDHLDYHKTLEEYGRVKATLFSSLRAGAQAVINIDDPSSGLMLQACGAGVNIDRCSMSDDSADWFGTITDRSLDGMQLSIQSPIGTIEQRVPFFGDYNASNVLISLGLAGSLLARSGMDEQSRRLVLEESLRDLKLPKGRLQRAESHADDVRVFVDFAHSDDSIRSSLSALRSVLPDDASLWCVFGCGGDRDRTKRPRMGQAACDGSDRVVLTSDNPRSENPSRIVDDVLSGLDASQRAKVEVQIDRSHAIRFAIEHAQSGDVIVIAGKGHESEQIMLGASGELVAHEFDDAAHARVELQTRRATAQRTEEIA
ncbi:MAG: UDP-N-acetylmuramoyl-L-alanyl-D-glutamate--2,6-diaminopimelate ligase [Phycisphaerales bacterium]|nr:UDP-N-acetylmuramoyl-L-alanyl-D-glutamate--2,6-diaminopimelate ligase [Phycisphaerales bacterium]